MSSPLLRRVAGVTLVTLSVVAAACERTPATRGASLAAQNIGQARIGPPAIPGVEGPFGVTQTDVPGQPWATGAPEVVTTAELMARRGRAAVRDRTAPTGITKIRPDRTGLADNPDARPVAQWPPSPYFRAGGPSAAFVPATPNVDIGFFADTGGSTPPDTMGDVGPTQYVLAMNGRVRAVSKATGAIDPVFDLDSDVFYGAAAAGAPTGDPRVRYDRRAGRWYILMFNIAVPNRYLLAVSSTSTITASTTWTIRFWANTRTQGGAGSVPCLGDYPTLGVDEDALYVGVNQFCGPDINQLGFDSTSVYVLNRASVLGGGSATITQFDGVLPSGVSAGPYTPQGVDNFDNGTDEGYFIGVDNALFSTLVVRRVSNPSGVPTLSGNINLTVPTTTFPITVPQPGGGTVRNLDAIDDRLMNAVIRNGTLWTVHQIGVNASGAGSSAAGARTAERWYQIGSLASTPTLIQSGTVFDSAATNPTHHWMGSIMVNGQGHVALGASRGGAATFVNTEFTGRLAGATLGTMETPTQYSSNTATLFNLQTSGTQRWGDYSYTSVDPNDDMTMWTLQEYPNASTSYAVRLIRLLAPPPAAIASVSPSSVAAGQAAVNVTVTGTSSSGSGFFDPGAGFANRIAAAFSGSGVTVSAVTVNSPTSLTLTLNTVGAATGARTLTVTNPDGQQAALASALTITAAGAAPAAVDDAYSTPFNTPLVVFAPGVLANDSANGGGTMTATSLTTPANGTLTFLPDGSFTFTPTNGFAGVTSFTYRAQNAGGPSNVATVTITVDPGLPLAADDSYTTPFNTPLVVAAPGVLANDTANGGSNMTAVLVSGPASGTLSLASSGGFTYTPAAAFTGLATFTYRAQSTGGQGNTATVSITVNAAPPPTGVPDSYTTSFNTPLTVSAPGVLGNDSANGGGALTATLVSGPASGTLTFATSGGFTFTPANGFVGQTSFTYRPVSANGGQGGTTTVTITVNAGQPVTVPDSYLTPFQTALNVAAPGVLANDLANGGTGLAAQLVSGPANGTLSLNGNGSFGYTPNAGYSGVDTFSYRAATSAGQGNTTTVTITVGQPAVGPPPTTNPDSYTTPYGVPLVVLAPGVLGNDAANGGTGLTSVLVTNAGNGSVSLSVDGSFSYTPNTNYSGTDSFTYRAVTSNGAGNTATVSITVQAPTGPLAPANFRIVRMQGTLVTFAWTPPASGPATTGFLLEGGLAPGNTIGTLTLPDTPSVTLSLPTGSFFLRLRTMAGLQLSGPSNELLAHINVPVPPSAPANLLGLVNGSAVQLAWTPTFGGGAPTGAVLDVSGTLSGSVPLGPAELFSFPSLPPGTFTFSVRQTNAGGSSPASSPVTLTFPGPCTGAPQAPANFLAYKSGGQLYLLWDPPASGVAPSSYTLNVSGAFTGSVPMGGARSLTVPVSGGSYTFSVTASNACGASAATASQTVSFP